MNHSVINIKIKHYTKEASPNNTNWPNGSNLEKTRTDSTKNTPKIQKCAIFSLLTKHIHLFQYVSEWHHINCLQHFKTHTNSTVNTTYLFWVSLNERWLWLGEGRGEDKQKMNTNHSAYDTPTNTYKRYKIDNVNLLIHDHDKLH
jgi:hypothetical protein